MNFINPYNRKEFTDFLLENFPTVNLKPEEIIIERKFNFIKSINKIGKSKELELDIYEITHLSENDPRVSLSREAFSLMKEYSSHRSLIIFKNDKTLNYRLSLITFQSSWETGKKIKIEFSNPRRYSFFLGPNAKINTPNRFLIKDGQIKNFDDLLARFNVEIVTKEFFENYKKLFDRLLAYLNKDHAFQSFAARNGVKTANFAKKLLGQIVFLYFLQRKGWLGAKGNDSISMGDKDFLRSLFNKSVEKKENFYNTYLEPLFYGALNRPPEKAGSYYRTYFDCQIPFLNGGLFEPPQDYDWDHEFLLLPDKLFSKDPNNPSHGEGILDIFDLYNFTVDESDFLDKEVSVDPEMLGKVFENLLEENLRKGKGTYYTPREIVNYMCEESVVNYLTTETGLTSEDIKNKYFPAYNVLGDEKLEVRDASVSESIIDSLKNIRVVDPACGSGAFLVGMLKQITNLRYELEGRSKLLGRRVSASSEYEIKKQTIQSCIYGVDIDPGAVDIAKLRLWLSLVVDYNLEEIEPLPNLDYKIMVGNSLIEKLDTNFLAKGQNYKKNELIDELKELKDKYFSSSESKEKASLRLRINEIIRLLVNYDNEQEREKIWAQILGRKNQIKLFKFDDDQQSFADINSYTKKLEGLKDFTETDHFEWHLNFNEVFEKGGFDIVIANPPYVGEKDNKDTFRPIARSPLGKRFYQGKMDLFYFFFHIALDYLRKGGVMAYITTNYYITATAGEKLRKDIQDRATILQLLSFSKLKIFDSALGQHNMITILKKDKSDILGHTLITNRSGYLGSNILSSVISEEDNETQYYSLKQSDFYSNGYIKLTSGELDKVLDKVWRNGAPVKDVADVNKGIETGANEIFLFKYSPEFYDKLNSIEKKFFRPYYKNSDIKKYQILHNKTEYILYIDNETEFDKNIPEIKNYLESKKEKLMNRAQIKRSNQRWYTLLWPRNVKMFEGEAIVTSYRPKKTSFGYKNFPFYSGTDTYYITNAKENYSLKYILGVINSLVADTWFLNRGKIKGDILEMTGDNIEKFPIPLISSENQVQVKSIEKIVNKILAITKSRDYLEGHAKKEEIKEYKKQIDQLVYKLYGLTAEEIKIVESR